MVVLSTYKLLKLSLYLGVIICYSLVSAQVVQNNNVVVFEHFDSTPLPYGINSLGLPERCSFHSGEIISSGYTNFLGILLANESSLYWYLFNHLLQMETSLHKPIIYILETVQSPNKYYSVLILVEDKVNDEIYKKSIYLINYNQIESMFIKFAESYFYEDEIYDFFTLYNQGYYYLIYDGFQYSSNSYFTSNDWLKQLDNKSMSKFSIEGVKTISFSH